MGDDLLPLTFDRKRRQLRLGDNAVELRPKEAEILHYLLERAGKVVSAAELQKAIWSEVKVGADALKTLIYTLRKRLGDSQQHPRYIENVPRRGYRFIGPLAHFDPLPSSSNTETVPPGFSQLPASLFVRREVELATLSNLITKARTGQRQIVFITGEPGIGKTTLVEMFLQQLAVTPAILIARGQCVEQYGRREAYRPLLEAITRLYQQHGEEEGLALLRKHAPVVLTELPALSYAIDSHHQQKIPGEPQERMLRELVAVLEMLSHDRPLILILEDLHWSDLSTIDVLSTLARRTEPAQLFVICTYRPMDALRDKYPIHTAVQALLEQGRGQELSVPPFTEVDLASYLEMRFASLAIIPETLSAVLQQRTAGNPRFLLNLIDALEPHGLSLQTTTPPDLTQLFAQLKVPPSTTEQIERQLRRLTPAEQSVLLAASVVSNEFSAKAVAVGLHQDVVQVEALCEALVAQQQFISHQGARRIPERRRSTRYSFRHALYCEVLALAIPTAQYHQFCQRIMQWQKQTDEAEASE